MGFKKVTNSTITTNRTCSIIAFSQVFGSQCPLHWTEDTSLSYPESFCPLVFLAIALYLRALWTFAMGKNLDLTGEWVWLFFLTRDGLLFERGTMLEERMIQPFHHAQFWNLPSQLWQKPPITCTKVSLPQGGTPHLACTSSFSQDSHEDLYHKRSEKLHLWFSSLFSGVTMPNIHSTEHGQNGWRCYFKPVTIMN